MTERIVDGLEMIDVEHQAGDMRALTPRARQLLFKAHLQVTAIVPAGQYIGEAAA